MTEPLAYPGERRGKITAEDVAAFQAWRREHVPDVVLRGGSDIERLYLHDDPALGVKATVLSEDPASDMGPEKVAYRHRGRYQVCNLLYKGRVLELASGCGYGHALIAASPWVKEIVSLEPDYLSCLYAYSHFRHAQKGKIFCGYAPEDIPPGKYDTITMIELFEHVPKEAQEALTPALFDRLNPGGLLIATTPYATQDGPNPNNPYHLYERTRESFLAHFRGIFGDDHVQEFIMGRQRMTEGTVQGLGFVVAEKP